VLEGQSIKDFSKNIKHSVAQHTINATTHPFKQPVLARYNSNGFLDMSFGNGGIAVVDVNACVYLSAGEVQAVAIGSNGAIVGAGFSKDCEYPTSSRPHNRSLQSRRQHSVSALAAGGITAAYYGSAARDTASFAGVPNRPLAYPEMDSGYNAESLVW
jgi:hypothetical protein